MRTASFVSRGRQLAALACCLVLWACSGDDSNNVSQPAPDNGTPAAKANSVTASVREAGDVIAYVGQAKTITIEFTTSDGAPAKALKLQPPAAPGWQSDDGNLGCDSVAGAASCALKLRYAPDAPAASATLQLSYSYTDSTGAAKSGSLAVNYSALAANAASVSIAPSAVLRAVVGTISTLTVSFATNDGSLASNLQLATDMLPAGWSSSVPVLDCPSFGAGSACGLQLYYQPAAATASSSFKLAYRYTDSAGMPQMAAVAISYSALAPNTVAAAIEPAGEVVAAPMASREVTLTFLPSDGYAASGLKLGASSLPDGWSIKSSTLPCDKVGADGNCRLVLSFKPQGSQPQQQFELGYDYLDASGQSKSGKAGIAYTSRLYRAYVADFYDGSGTSSGGVRQCELSTDGALANCMKAEATWPQLGTYRVVPSGSHAYVSTSRPAEFHTRAISVCGIGIDGGLTNCADAGLNLDRLNSFAVLGQYAYLTSIINNLYATTRCVLNADGNVLPGSCTQLSFDITGRVATTALTSLKSSVYIATVAPATPPALGQTGLLQCWTAPENAAGTQCKSFQSDYPLYAQSMAGASLEGGDYLYLLSANLTTGTVVKCNLGADGSITGCDGGKLPGGVNAEDLAQAADIAIIGKQAYIAVAVGRLRGILRCPIDGASGDLQACVALGDTGSNQPAGIGLR
jgi:hypothetical protein